MQLTKSAKKLLRPQSQRLVLEPRIVFDAVVPVMGAEALDYLVEHTATDTRHAIEAPAIETPATTDNHINDNENHAASDRALIDGTLAPTNLAAKEIIFIDAIVADLQQYITDHPNADVVLLDANRDGLEQIAATLAGRTGIESVHILSHGSAGNVSLGNTSLNLAGIQGQYADELAIIKAALSANADILIYGCNVAEGQSGLAFVNALANATGADIAASTDLTGANRLGGDWDFETQVGSIESLKVINAIGQTDFNQLLGPAPISLNFGTPTVLVDATGGLVGDKWLYANVTPGVDAVVTISAVTGSPVLGNIDAPSASGGRDAAFQPVITSIPSANERITFTISFVVTGTATTGSPTGTATTLSNFIATGVDVDGAGNATEFASYVLPDSSKIEVGSSVTQGGTATNPTFTGISSSLPGIGLETTEANYSVFYDKPVSSITFSLGNTGSAGGAFGPRQNSISFDSNDIKAYNSPVSVGDSATATEGNSITFNILDNDWGGEQGTDGARVETPLNQASVDLDPTTAGIQTTRTIAGQGTFTYNGNGTVTFAAAGNFNGEVTPIQYTVSNTVVAGLNPVAETANAASIRVTVTAVNDEPAGADKTITTAEDTAVSLSIADFGFTDPNDTPANAFTNLIITTLPTTGTLRLSGVAVTAGQVITAANIPNLTWTPAPNANGNAISSFTFQVVDGGGTANGGQNTDQSPNVITFNVTPTDDAPINTVPGTQNTNEDVPIVFSNANGNPIQISDADGGTQTVTLTIANGSVTLSGIAGLTFTTGDGTSDGLMTFSGSIAAINTALNGLIFTPTPDYNNTSTIAPQASISIKTANATQSVPNFINGGFEQIANVSAPTTFIVTSENNLPGWDTSATDNQVEIWRSGFNGFSGPGVPAFEGNFFAEINANQAATLFNVFTPVAGSAVSVDFAHRGRNGTDVMQVQAIDLGADGVLGGTGTNADTVLFTQNYSDGNTAWGAYTANITNNATGNAIQFGFTAVSAAGGISSGNFVDGIVVRQGPVDVDVININVTPVKDTVADNLTTPEDTPITFNVLTNAAANGAAADDFEGSPIVSSITQPLPSAGSVTFTAAGSMTFTPKPGFSGTATFTYTVTSPAGVTETETVTITVTNVNDEPYGTDKTITILEDTPYTVTVADFGFSDANDTPANAFTNIIVGSTLPPATEGVYRLNGVAIAPNQVISVADINAGKLTFSPAANVNTPVGTLGTLSFQVQDNGATGGLNQNTDQTPNTLKFSITPVNDVVTYGSLSDNSTNVPNTDAQVFEKDLATGSTPSGSGEVVNGSFTLGPITSLASFTLGGATTGAITAADLLNSGTTPIVRPGTFGTLVINGYNPATSVVSYTYTLTSRANHTAGIVVNEVYGISTIDVDTPFDVNNTNSLRINIVDDAPIAVADIDETVSFPGSPSSTASGNVVTGVDIVSGDPNSTDGNKDTLGADTNANPVTAVIAGFGIPTTAISAGSPANVTGNFGQLVLNANGNYTYTPNYTNPTVAGLQPGQSITDTFTYQITDSDGDTATTTLKINIVGIPAVVGLGDGTVAGTDGSVLESDLGAGTNAVGTGEVLNGNFQLLVSVPNTVAEITVGTTVIPIASLTASGTTPITVAGSTGAGAGRGVLIINGYNPATGVVSYQYTLNTPDNSSGTVIENFAVSLKDSANNITPPKNLGVAIIDDAPIATNDTASITENTASTPTLNVFTNDKIGADGPTIASSPVTGLVAGTGSVGSANVGTALAGNYGSIILNADGSYVYNLNNANPAVNALKAGQSLTETYSYKITDKDGDTATATLTITINGANDAPLANDNIYNMLEDGGTITLNPLAGDTDPDGDTLTIQSITNNLGNPVAITPGTPQSIPVNDGTVNVSAGGVVTFTPNSNFNGTVTFRYTISDGTTTAFANQIINVAAVNDAPIANPNTKTIVEDAPAGATGNVITENNGSGVDTDPDTGNSTGLTVTQFSIAGVPGSFAAGTTATIAAGTVRINANGSYVFTPALNFNGTVPQITYTISDGSGAVNQTATSTLNITVTPVNDAPVANNNTYNMNEDGGTITLNPLNGDTDVDGDTLTITNIAGTAITPGVASGPIAVTGGVVNVSAAGIVTFTPNANYNGTTTFAYTISDGTTTANANQSIVVAPVNDSPVAVDDTFTTLEDTPVILDLLTAGTDDSDPDLDPLSIKSINGTLLTPGTVQNIAVPNGVVAVSATGVVTFKPNANYNGPVTFDYVVQDGKGGEDTGAVNITVTAVNDAPIANPDTAFTPEDTPISGNVLGNDTDVDSTVLTVTSFTIAGQAGPFVFGTPTAIADNLANPIGTITLNSDGSYTFNPALNFNGVVPVITYNIADNGLPIGTASSTLSITVGSDNDPPVAVSGLAVANEDAPTVPVNLSGSDIDGTIATVTLTGALPTPAQGTLYFAGGITPVPAGATLTPAQAASLVFVPAPNFNGTVVIPFTVTDNDGAISAPANFTIQIAAVNDAPVANPDTGTTPEDTPISGNIKTNDTDVDSPTLTITQITIGGTVYSVPAGAAGITVTLTQGDITVRADGSYNFAPALNFNGAVPTITYTVNDGSGSPTATATSTLNLTVTPVNDAPVAVTDNYTIAEDGAAITLAPLTSDTDVDGNTLTVASINGTAIVPGTAYPSIPVTGGVISVTAAGVISFTPNPNFNGTVTFPYTISDGNGGTATANQVIAVTPVNDPPVATPTTATGAEDTPIPVGLAGTDVEDGTPNIVKVTTLPPTSQGTLFLADGTTPVTANTPLTAAQAAGLVFKPAANFNGTVNIPFTVTDSNGVTSPPANAVITVTPVNDNPIAVTDNYTVAEDGAAITLNPLTSDTDVDGNTLTVTSINGVAVTPNAVIPVTGGTINVSTAGVISFTPNPNFNGTVTVPYTISDGNGGTATASQVITVTPVNDPPVATPTTVTVNEDNPATVNLLGTDVEDAAANLITKVTTLPPPTQGVLYLADGVTKVVAGSPLTAAQAAGLIFIPAPNFNGPVTIPFTITDTNGAVSSSANAIINVTPVNDPPVAISGSTNILQNSLVSPSSANVVLRGTDIDGTVATITVTQLPTAAEGILYFAGGTVPVVANVAMTPAQAATLVFIPTLNYNSTIGDLVQISFTAKDNNGADSIPGTFVIDITFVNQDPIATGIIVPTTPEDTPVIFTMPGTDVEDGANLAVSVTTLPPASQGVLYLSDGTTPVVAGIYYPPGSFVFVPAPNFNGPVGSIPYKVKDSQGQISNVANVTIVVSTVNDAPIAAPDTRTIAEDSGTTTGNVLSNDSDIDSPTLIVSAFAISGETGPFVVGTPYVIAGVGTITLNSNGAYTFAPAPNFNGTVPTVSYTVNDGSGTPTATATSTLDITVTPVNDPPVATPVTANGNEDNPFVPVALVGTDIDNATADLVTTVPNLPPASQGVLTLADATPVVAGQPLTNAQAAGIRFVPAPNFNGTVTIPFTVKDPAGLTSTANAVINIAAVNDAPVPTPDTKTTNEDTTATGNVLSNDSDLDSPSLTVTQFVVNGSLVNVPSGGTGTITITEGKIIIGSNGAYSFEPAPNFNGTVPTVSYTVNDGSGTPTATATSTLDITVTPVNDPPVATPVTANGNEDDAFVPVALVGTDIDNATADLVTTVPNLPPASQGVLTLADGTLVVAGQALTNAQAAGIRFVPAPNFNGTVTIPFTVKDPAGLTSTPNAVINIAAVNDAPVAAAGAYNGDEDAPLPFNISATDIEGPIASYTIITVPTAAEGIIKKADGTIVNAGDSITPAEAASLVFVPTPNYFGTANLTFTATDSDPIAPLTSAPATVTFTIADIVSPPVATPVDASGTSEKPIPISLGGTDADGFVASVTVQSLPPASQGILTLADGTPVFAGTPLSPAQAAGLIFVPATNFNGKVQIPFFVTDDEGNVSAISVANITITDTGVLFEQLASQRNPFGDALDPNRPDPFALRSPVIPIGMPEDLFVIHSVRESAMRIAQNSNFGVFNVDAPTRGELDNLTYDLKGLPVGMDPTLFVQHAVRSLPITQEPRLFVQNAVRQSQLESTMRNIGVNSYNTATTGVSSLFSPFDLGSPNDAIDLSIDGVNGEFAKKTAEVATKQPKELALDAITENVVNGDLNLSQLESSIKEANIDSGSNDEIDTHLLQKNLAVEPKKVAAASFANQLNSAAKKFKSNDIFNTNN